jgi:hypothetical protein
MIAEIPWLQSLSSWKEFWYGFSQIFELFHPFKGTVINLQLYLTLYFTCVLFTCCITLMSPDLFPSEKIYPQSKTALRVTVDWGSQISRYSTHEGDKDVRSTHRPPVSPRKYSWYSFLLQAELTSGSLCGRKDYVNENFRDFPGCSAVRQPLLWRRHPPPPKKKSKRIGKPALITSFDVTEFPNKWWKEKHSCRISSN